MTGSGVAPLELQDQTHNVWQSAGSMSRWCENHGLNIRSDGIGPLDNHYRAAIAWAKANGLVRMLPAGNEWPDWAAMRAAGIPATASARIMERLEHAGVKIEGS